MISYGRHEIDYEDISAVTEVLKSDWLSLGPKVEEFESRIEQVTGAPTIAVSSGTAALHCAFAAIGIKAGDEIITPPMTFIATQATASLFGSTIVFADIQSDTGNIDPSSAEKVITGKTKAIVAVDFAGHPCDLDELREIASNRNIFLIEDASHSLGSKYKGINVGSIADITTFSFFPTKNITTGEGGAISSKNEALLDKARKFARQGLIRDRAKFKISDEGKWHQEVHEFGLNYRLSDVLCALGISQLRKLEIFKNKRIQIMNRYRDMLKDCKDIRLPVQRSYVDPFWHLFPIQVPAVLRRDFYEYMHQNGVKVQVNYMPAHWHPVFAKYGYKKGDFPRSESFYASEISMPIHTSLTIEEQDFIIKLTLDFFEVQR